MNAKTLKEILTQLTGMEERLIKNLTTQISANHAAIANLDQTIQVIETSINDFQGRLIMLTRPDIISPDQTGFIQGRHSYSNLRKLFNVIHSTRPKQHEAVISLDAEKAFDRVKWSHLFFTLRKIGFGNEFTAWIKLLYSSPLASIISNNTQSTYFPLGKGMRQGFALSSLLFAISIEALAITVTLRVYGERVWNSKSHYMQIICVSDLASSLPSILNILGQFGQISGHN